VESAQQPGARKGAATRRWNGIDVNIGGNLPTSDGDTLQPDGTEMCREPSRQRLTTNHEGEVKMVHRLFIASTV
jgi:hypothetical protein